MEAVYLQRLRARSAHWDKVKPSTEVEHGPRAGEATATGADGVAMVGAAASGAVATAQNTPAGRTEKRKRRSIMEKGEPFAAGVDPIDRDNAVED